MIIDYTVKSYLCKYALVVNFQVSSQTIVNSEIFTKFLYS